LQTAAETKLSGGMTGMGKKKTGGRRDQNEHDHKCTITQNTKKMCFQRACISPFDVILCCRSQSKKNGCSNKKDNKVFF
jgi:hypothetical protein